MIDPDTLATPAAFSAALADLRAQQGKSVRQVSRETGIPTGTLGGYFSGRHLPPLTQPESLAKLLGALGQPDESLPRWQAALARVRRAPASAPAAASPYRGLAPFRIDDHDLFFGREALVAQVLGELEAAQDDPAGSWVTVVGGSGCGKTSLLCAGVLAERREAGDTLVLLTPGPDPLAALEAAVASPLNVGREEPAEAADESAPPRTSYDGRRLVAVDQLEDVLAEDIDPADRARFLARLADLARLPGTSVVVTVRADFLIPLSEEVAVSAQVRHHRVAMAPMSEDELRAAIVEPALAKGRDVDPALVDLVLTDIRPGHGEPGVLSLLSHAMLATWQAATSTSLTVADYVSAGRVAGTIRESAEVVWRRLSPEDQAVARDLFERLTSINRDGVVTRQRVRRSELRASVPGSASTEEAFIAARVLTATEATVEITHEALFNAWPRLAEWLSEDAEALQLRGRVTHAARSWQDAGGIDELLLRGPVLGLVRSPDVQHVLPAGSHSLERRYIDASLAAESSRLESRRRLRLRIRALIASSAALALVATVLGVSLVVAMHDADAARRTAARARHEALSRRLADRSRDLAGSSPAVSNLLAVAAYRAAPTPEARSALLEASSRPGVTRMLGSAGTTRALYSPDGALVAVTGADGRVRFYRREPSRPLLPPERGPVVAVGARAQELLASAFSPDGRLFATGGSDGTVTVVDLADPEHPQAWATPLSTSASVVTGLAFSPDGTELAAATGGDAVVRWRIGDGEAAVLPPARGVEGPVESVAYGAGGRLAAGSGNGTIGVWRASPTGLLRLRARLRTPHGAAAPPPSTRLDRGWPPAWGTPPSRSGAWPATASAPTVRRSPASPPRSTPSPSAATERCWRPPRRVVSGACGTCAATPTAAASPGPRTSPPSTSAPTTAPSSRAPSTAAPPSPS